MDNNNDNISQLFAGGSVPNAGAAVHCEGRRMSSKFQSAILMDYIHCRKSVDMYLKNKAELIDSLASLYMSICLLWEDYPSLTENEKECYIEMREWTYNWIERLATRYYEDNGEAKAIQNILDVLEEF